MGASSDMDGAQLDRVEKAVERLEDVSQALKRAVVGSEDEGNPGHRGDACWGSWAELWGESAPSSAACASGPTRR